LGISIDFGHWLRSRATYSSHGQQRITRVKKQNGFILRAIFTENLPNMIFLPHKPQVIYMDYIQNLDFFISLFKMVYH